MTGISSQGDIDETSELRCCISRLSYVGMGLSDEIDPLLRKLRALVKADANITQLKSNIDKISQALRLIDDSQSENKVAAKKPKKKGFLSGLFTRQGDSSTPDNNRDITHLAISPNLRASLQHLVDQLSVMEDHSQTALTLTKKVNAINKVEELASILELIAGAFVEVSSLERQQFENFLKSLNKRIDRINGFINHVLAHSSQVTHSSERLSLSFQNSVPEIEASFDISAEHSLELVKKRLCEKLAAILTNLDLFTSAQEGYQLKLNKELKIISEQLRTTEDEASRLKDDLAEQRGRAHTDSLTLLPNRYAYNERLTQEYNRWRRYRSPLTIVIADIDHFKQVNDAYGHVAGDEVLREVSQYLLATLRESDFIARTGGEEFVILLPETSLMDAIKAINKLRQGVKDIRVNVGEKSLSIAMSFGISSFENSDTPREVFSRADKALYRAKDKGRDQVCCQRSDPT